MHSINLQKKDQHSLHIKNSNRSVYKRQICWLPILVPEIHHKEISLEVIIINLPFKLLMESVDQGSTLLRREWKSVTQVR